MKTQVLALTVALVTVTSSVLATDLTISTNTIWSGTVTVDGKVSVISNANLTLQPGTIVNFVGSGEIVSNGGGTFSAQGTAALPIQFNGTQTGNIRGYGLGATFSNCSFTGMGKAGGNWVNYNPSGGGFSMNNCTITNCAGYGTVNGAGPETLSNSSLNGVSFVQLISTNGSAISVTHNNIQNVAGYLSTSSSKSSDISYNVVINCGGLCSTGSTGPANIAIHDNYIDNPTPTSQYGIESTIGQIYNNVIRGGSWGNGGVAGGHVYNNVIESCVGTHEQSGLADNTVFERNIIIGSSMAGIMTGSNSLGNNAVVRNNTFDLRGTIGSNSSAPIYLNHLPTYRATGMNVRNNLFLRTGRMYDESSYADTIGYVDYNCWAGRTTDGYGGSSSRFANISITGKTEGDDGFGMHDTILPTLAQGYNPASLVQNANFTDPFSDADMLSGTHTVAELLALYQQAYTPVAGSALINAGSPVDSSDPSATYGRIDIGAVEAAVVAGDANLNRVTDFHDYLILEQNFGKSNATWAMGDFNNDRVVDFHDYLILEANFGHSVPEPATLALLIAGLFTLKFRRNGSGVC